MILLHLSAADRARIEPAFSLLSHLIVARLAAIELGAESQASLIMESIEAAGNTLEGLLVVLGVVTRTDGAVTFDLERDRIVITNEAGEDLWLLPQGVFCSAE